MSGEWSLPDMDLSSPFENGVHSGPNTLSGPKLLDSWKQLEKRTDLRRQMADAALAAQQALSAAQQQNEDMETFQQLKDKTEEDLREFDVPEPPKSGTYLRTPTFVEPEGLPDDDELVCALQSACTSGAVTSQELTTQALIGGWLTDMYASRDGVPASVCKWLFRLMSFSADSQVALCAYNTFMQLVRGFSDGAPAPAGLLHGHHATLPTLAWLPGGQDFLDALKSHGVSVKAGGKAGNQQEAVKPAMLNLQLIIKTLAIITDGRTKGTLRFEEGCVFSVTAAEQLLSMVLHMGLDPAAQVLQPDLWPALLGVINVVDQGDWEKRFWNVAVEVASAGPSYRAAAQIIAQLPRSYPRCALLQQHAAKLLLEKVVTREAIQGKRKGKDPEPVRLSGINKRAAVGPLNVLDVVSGLPWMTESARVVAAAAFKDKLYSYWELWSAIELTDVLLSPLTQKDEENLTEEDAQALGLFKRQMRELEHCSALKVLGNLPAMQLRMHIIDVSAYKYNSHV